MEQLHFTREQVIKILEDYSIQTGIGLDEMLNPDFSVEYTISTLSFPFNCGIFKEFSERDFFFVM